MPQERVLIIGAGQAGSQTATSLRQFGYQGLITIVGTEPNLPYQRPPLSKAYLKGELEKERLYIKPADWHEANNVEVLLSQTVTSLNVSSKVATTNKGQNISFNHLVFATGSRNRLLPMEGANLDNVFGLRTLNDVDQLRPHITTGKNIVIIGAGYIGLETAAIARELGANVTVLEIAERVLARVTGPQISAFYETLHRSYGVDIRAGTQTKSLNGHDGAIDSLTLETGDILPCDALLIGIGIQPNIELAEESGIECEDGILVNQGGRTNIENFYAAGDCAKRVVMPYGRVARLESVHNAIEQAKLIAAAITEKPAPKLDCPWFWSDQYDVKLQIAGLSDGYDNSIVRGSIEDNKFAVFYLREGVLIAADAVNSAPEFMAAKRLIRVQARVPAELLANTNVALKEILTQWKE